MIALVALGYTMVYGVLKLINFAHSEVFMMGAYGGFFFMSGWAGKSILWCPRPFGTSRPWWLRRRSAFSWSEWRIARCADVNGTR